MACSLSRGWRLALALLAALSMIAQPEHGQAQSRTSVGVATAPEPVNQLGSTPGYGANGPVTFSYSSHFYRPGDTVSATMRMASAECRILSCYVGTSWTDAGAPPNRCRPSVTRCSWRLPATAPLYLWHPAQMSITTTLGLFTANDYYAVIPRAQSVLEAHVGDAAGHPYPALTLHLNGPISATLTTDGNGFAVGLLPTGRYHVVLDAGTAAASASFRPSAQALTVHGVIEDTIIGYAHLQVIAAGSSVLSDGMQAITVTVHASTPLGQPAAGLSIQTRVSGPDALLCALPPGGVGYVEPQSVIGGTPLYLPVDQAADANGNLSYQVYFGTEPGLWRLTVADSTLGARDPWLSRRTASVGVRIKPVAWARFFPARFRLKLYDARGHGKVASLSPAQEIWHALHGETVPFAAKQSNGLTLAALNVGDSLGDQRALLRWMEAYVPLHGLEIGPVFSGGSTNWGVAIFPHHRFGTAETHILDAATLAAILAAPQPLGLPALPTPAQWAASTHSIVLQAT